MLYQVAKEAGAWPRAMRHVDAILLTGGMAPLRICGGSPAQAGRFSGAGKGVPGELEMQALGQAACRALLGLEPVKEL